MYRFKKTLCIMLCVVLAISGVPFATAAQTQSEKTYDIYPVVRDIAYDGTQFVLGEQVNVVYETGIDDATKAYLDEVLEENGITAAVAAAPAAGEVNILLGVNGSGESADTYAATLALSTADLYEKYDAYVLEAKENQIYVSWTNCVNFFCKLNIFFCFFNVCVCRTIYNPFYLSVRMRKI